MEEPNCQRLGLTSVVAETPDGVNKGVGYATIILSDFSDQRQPIQSTDVSNRTLASKANIIAAMIANAIGYGDGQFVDYPHADNPVFMLSEGYLHPNLIRAAGLRRSDLDPEGNIISEFGQELRAKVATLLQTNPSPYLNFIANKTVALEIVDIFMRGVRRIVANITGQDSPEPSPNTPIAMWDEPVTINGKETEIPVSKAVFPLYEGGQDSSAQVA